MNDLGIKHEIILSPEELEKEECRKLEIKVNELKGELEALYDINISPDKKASLTDRAKSVLTMLFDKDTWHKLIRKSGRCS